MLIWEIDKIVLFLVLVLPGFISLKVYELIVAKERADFSKSLVDVICYSVLNFAVLSWLLIIISKKAFWDNHPFCFWLSICFIFVIMPSIWPFLYVWLSKRDFFKKYFLSPTAQPWDYVFSKREALWVVVHLKNGKIIRGKYGKDSFASSYPNKKEIYLQELWKSKKKGGFKEKIKRSNGAILFEDEISFIEFYK